MEPDRNNLLGVQPLNHQSSREWVSLQPFLHGNAQQFNSADLVPAKDNMAENPATINRYPQAAYRVNADGLVVMRGLIQRVGGGNWATGEQVFHLPKNIQPKHPQELRWAAGTYVLRYNPTNEMVMIDVNTSGGVTSWCMLYNIVYYID